MQEKIMSLIGYSGDSKSYSMEAIAAARKGKIDEAKVLLVKANEAIVKAHNIQTSLIQAEAGGDKIEFFLLMVHAQNHFMTSMTFKDLAEELVEIYSRI